MLVGSSHHFYLSLNGNVYFLWDKVLIYSFSCHKKFRWSSNERDKHNCRIDKIKGLRGWQWRWGRKPLGIDGRGGGRQSVEGVAPLPPPAQAFFFCLNSRRKLPEMEACRMAQMSDGNKKTPLPLIELTPGPCSPAIGIPRALRSFRSNLIVSRASIANAKIQRKNNTRIRLHYLGWGRATCFFRNSIKKKVTQVYI